MSAKLREIEILSRLSTDVSRFRSACHGHLHIAESRGNDLVYKGQSIYDQMESKRKQIQEKLERAQQSYDSCMYRHKNDKDDHDPCSMERSRVAHYSDLLQEVSSVCQQAQSRLGEIKSEQSGLTSICHQTQAEIESGVSSATGALSSIRGSAEEYAHVKAPVSGLTIPTSTGNGVVVGTNSGNRTTGNGNASNQETEVKKPNFAIPENLSNDYSASETGASTWITDRNERKVMRIRKNGNAAVLSGFDIVGSSIDDFSAIEIILQHNRVADVSCWITADEMDFYRQAGFAVKEKSEGGFIVTKQYK